MFLHLNDPIVSGPVLVSRQQFHWPKPILVLRQGIFIRMPLSDMDPSPVICDDVVTGFFIAEDRIVSPRIIAAPRTAPNAIAAVIIEPSDSAPNRTAKAPKPPRP